MLCISGGEHTDTLSIKVATEALFQSISFVPLVKGRACLCSAEALLSLHFICPSYLCRLTAGLALIRRRMLPFQEVYWGKCRFSWQSIVITPVLIALLPKSTDFLWVQDWVTVCLPVHSVQWHLKRHLENGVLRFRVFMLRLSVSVTALNGAAFCARVSPFSHIVHKNHSYTMEKRLGQSAFRTAARSTLGRCSVLLNLFISHLSVLSCVDKEKWNI